MNNTLLKKSNFEIDNNSLPIFNTLKIHCYNEQPNSEIFMQMQTYIAGIELYTSDGSASIAKTDKKYTNKLKFDNTNADVYVKPGNYDLLISPKYQLKIISFISGGNNLGIHLSDITYIKLSGLLLPSKNVVGKLSELPKNTLISCVFDHAQLTGDLSDIPQNNNLGKIKIPFVPAITGNISILAKYDKMGNAVLQKTNINGSLESLIAGWEKKLVKDVKKRHVEVSSPVTFNGNNVSGILYTDSYFGNENVCMFNVQTKMLIGVYTISSGTWKYSWSASAHDTIQFVSDQDSPSWSITDGSSFASISSSGLLTCNAEGVATVSDGTNTFKVTIGA